MALFSKKVLKHASCIIAPTKKVQSLLNSYGVNQNVHVVPTGIYLKPFLADFHPDQKQSLLKKLDIPEDHQILLFVGRLAKEKNIEEVLDYFSKLNTPKLTLLIVGDGPHRNDLQQYSSYLSIEKKVVFTGLIKPENIVSYYQIADLFVSASNSETQGLTYIEALACGLPAICKNDPCLENVISNGKNGWKYNDYTDFQKAVHSLLTNPLLYQKFSLNAKEGAIRDYSSKTFAIKMEGIYAHTIAEYYLKTEYVF
ncbi:glycosyltransferase [Gracilibacillus boraciitolerans JCM 21714]|uniref:Glycosyltransferase n=1 Tax=Gracilibacillus boraciitolerans JCM 21714 TaxID=1298598 RepID=W4VK20_9BACI|nr:glycosyltransferase [Gracilibacillus boraciitolerans JCM 21714]